MSIVNGKLKNPSRFHAIMRELERGVLLDALNKTGFNLCKAARDLGIHRNILLRHCKACDINLGQWRRELAAAVIPEEKMRRIA